MLSPYQPPALAREVAARVVTDALSYALELPFAPASAAEVQEYLTEFGERVDVILAPYDNHADIMEAGEAIKRGALAYAFAKAADLFTGHPA